MNDKRRGPTILVVEDDRELALSLQIMLDLRGVQVEVFADARAAAQRVLGRSDDIDLLLLDIALPEQDGVELLRQLQSQGVTLPVLVSSGAALSLAEAERRELGVRGFLQKPYAGTELIDAIQAVLGALD